MIDVSDVFSHKAQRLPGFASNITSQIFNIIHYNEDFRAYFSSKLLQPEGRSYKSYNASKKFFADESIKKEEK